MSDLHGLAEAEKVQHLGGKPYPGRSSHGINTVRYATTAIFGDMLLLFVNHNQLESEIQHRKDPSRDETPAQKAPDMGLHDPSGVFAAEMKHHRAALRQDPINSAPSEFDYLTKKESMELNPKQHGGIVSGGEKKTILVAIP